MSSPTNHSAMLPERLKGDAWLQESEKLENRPEKNHFVMKRVRNTHGFRVVDKRVSLVVAKTYIDQILHSVLPLVFSCVTLDK